MRPAEPATPAGERTPAAPAVEQPAPAGPAGEPAAADAECDDTGGCVTCSDAATPGTVRRLLDGDLAIVDTGAGTEEVSVALVDVTTGDVVYVHAGETIAVRRDTRDQRDVRGPGDGTGPR